MLGAVAPAVDVGRQTSELGLRQASGLQGLPDDGMVGVVEMRIKGGGPEVVGPENPGALEDIGMA